MVRKRKYLRAYGTTYGTSDQATNEKLAKAYAKKMGAFVREQTYITGLRRFGFADAVTTYYVYPKKKRITKRRKGVKR
jgi:hypothetical protein